MMKQNILSILCLVAILAGSKISADNSELSQIIYSNTWLLHEKGSTLGWSGKFEFRRNGKLTENLATGEGAYAVTGTFSLTGSNIKIQFQRYSTYETDSCINGSKPRTLKECLSQAREKHSIERLTCSLVKNEQHIKYSMTLECTNGQYLASERYELKSPRDAVFDGILVEALNQEKSLGKACFPFAKIGDENTIVPDIFGTGPLPLGVKVKIIGQSKQSFSFKNKAEKWYLGQIWTEPTWQPAIWLPSTCFFSN